MILSATEIGTARRCKWKWQWGSFNGDAITPIVPPTALNLGRMIHEAHARWEMNPTASLTMLYAELEREAAAYVQKKFMAAQGAPMPDIMMESIQKEVFDLGRAMCTNYETFYGQPVPDNFVVIQPEQTIIVDIPGTEHEWEWSHAVNHKIQCPHPPLYFVKWPDGKWVLSDVDAAANVPTSEGVVVKKIAACSGIHQLECTLDSLIQNVDTGIVWIRERKTWEKHPTKDELNRNDQFSKYSWALSQPTTMEMLAAVSLTGNPHIGGLAYDGMWKRTYVPKGRRFDELFLRLNVEHSPTRLEIAHHHMVQEVMDLTTSPYLYPDPNWSGCWDCKELRDMCTARLEGERWTDYLNRYTDREPEYRWEIWAKPSPTFIRPGGVREPLDEGVLVG